MGRPRARFVGLGLFVRRERCEPHIEPAPPTLLALDCLCCLLIQWVLRSWRLASLSTPAGKPMPWRRRRRIWLTKVSVVSYSCRSLANMLPAAVGATLAGAVAYCELLPQCFCCLSLLLTPLLAACVQLPWRLQRPRRLLPTRAPHRRRRR